MKIKTSELNDRALNFAVAKCLANVHEDAVLNGTIMHGWWISGLFTDPNCWIRNDEFNPSTNWEQGGPILERRKLDSFWNQTSERWSVAGWDERAKREVTEWGDTLLEASMRCYVASTMGDEVEIPYELL